MAKKIPPVHVGLPSSRTTFKSEIAVLESSTENNDAWMVSYRLFSNPCALDLLQTTS